MLGHHHGVVKDAFGNGVPFATVYVRRMENLAGLAVLKSNQAGTSGKNNPITADEAGRYDFYTAGGWFFIRAESGTDFWELEDVPVGTAQALDALPRSGGVQLVFDDATADAAPDPGYLRFNNANHSLATFAYIADADFFGNSIATLIDSWDDAGGPNHKGTLRVEIEGNPAAWRQYIITGAVIDASGYKKVPIAVRGTPAGTFADGSPLSLLQIPAAPGAAAELSYAGHTAFGSADTIEEGLDAAGDKLQHITVTQPVDLDALEARVNGLDAAVVLRGTWSAAGGTFPNTGGGGIAGAVIAGDSFIVSVAGTVGGVAFAVGDRLIAIADVPSATVYAGNWHKADYTDLVQSVDGATGALTLGAIIAAAAGKTTPVDADAVALSDSAASGATKKLTWANLKTAIKGYLDPFYAVALADPGGDRIRFWDDSAGQESWLSNGANLYITGTTLNASGGGGSGGSSVADRTALKALTPVDGDVAFLREGVPAAFGRFGTFIFSDDNLSAKVAADAREGIYVAPASDVTGASGAWVRLTENSEFNICWFGAAGNGSTDDSPAVQGAHDLLAIGSTGGVIHVPGGPYFRLATQINITENSIHIKGDGRRSSTFYLNAHTFDCFNVTATHNFTFSGIGFLGVGSPSNGKYLIRTPACVGVTIFDVDGSNAISSGFLLPYGQTLIEQVKFSGLKVGNGIGVTLSGTPAEVATIKGLYIFNALGQDCFAGVRATAGAALIMEDCQLCSCGIPISIDVPALGIFSSLVLDNVWCDTSAGTGLHLTTHATGTIQRVRITNSWFSSCERGIRINGNVLGISITNSELYGNAQEGILVEAGSLLTRLFVGAGTQIAGNGGFGVQFGAGVDNWHLADLTIGPSGGFGANAAGILIGAGCDNFSIIDCRLQGNTGASVVGPTDGAGVIIEGNTGFWEPAASILLADFAGSNVNTAQPVFAAAQDTITLIADATYEFEAEYFITRAAGTTSHTTGVLFGGTATFDAVSYLAQVTNPTGNALANVQQIWAAAATLVTLTAANTAATENIIIKLKGHIRTAAAGTLIPQFQYSAAPGGAPTIKANSFFKIKPIGSDQVALAGAVA